MIARWTTRVGAEGRVPAGWDRARRERPDSSVLAASGFRALGSYRFPAECDWTVDALIGFVYSTSVLPRAVLGESADAFEEDVRHELDRHATAGTLHETIDFAYELARSPTRWRPLPCDRSGVLPVEQGVSVAVGEVAVADLEGVVGGAVDDCE